MYFKSFLSEITTLETQSERIPTRYCNITVKELNLRMDNNCY